MGLASKDDGKKKPPAFFKAFFTKSSGTHMELPYTDKTFPKSVILQDKNKNKWEVKMVQNGALWCLAEGWINFMNDNRLIDGDVLTLEYIREGLFMFRILGHSACQKIVFGPFNFVVKDNVIRHVIPDLNEVLDDCVWEVDDPMQEIEDGFGAEDGHGIGGLSIHGRHVEDPILLEDDDNNGDSLVHGNEDNNGGSGTNDMEVEDPVHGDEDTIGGSSMNTVEAEDEDDAAEEDYTGRGGKERQRRRDQWLGTEIFAAGLAPRPKNPYFVTHFKTVKRAELFVPKHVLKMNNIEFPAIMSVFDPSGRKFTVSRSKNWGDDNKKTYYSGGWKSLCKSNMVNPNDHCIVQFVKGEATGIVEARVSFVRAAAAAAANKV